MAGTKPVLRIVAKSKNSDNFKSIAAFWDNEGRLGGKLDKEVSHIVFADGTEISNENAWINVYDDRAKGGDDPMGGGGSSGFKPKVADAQPKVAAAPPAAAAKTYDDGDIPF
tara:strand:- start:4799 stop:5134 length:336 start_codon:yes stop_codon:yes gene_type:complete